MFDITISEISSSGYFYCFALFLITYFVGIRQTPFSLSGTNRALGRLFFVILLLLALLTAFNNTDYFSYLFLVKNTSGHYTPHLEPIYGYIIQFCNYNYLLFRLVVWGGALLIFMVATKLSKVSTPSSLFILFLLFFPIFDYARASLAMAIYFLGYVILARKYRFLLYFPSIVLGVVLILSSYFFHRSMVALIVMTPILFLPLNKKTLVALILLAPIFLFVIKDQLINLLGINFNVDELEQLNNTFSMYSDRDDVGVANWKGIISLVLLYSLFYVPFIYITKVFLSGYSSPLATNLFKIVFGIMILCHSMLLLGPQSQSLYYRYLYMTMIPMTILLVQLFEDHQFSDRSFFRLVKMGFFFRFLLFVAGSIKFLN